MCNTCKVYLNNSLQYVCETPQANLNLFKIWMALQMVVTCPQCCCKPSGILILLMLEKEYSSVWVSIPCLLMHWLLKSPVYQQAWYWLCRTDNTMDKISHPCWDWSLSMLKMVPDVFRMISLLIALTQQDGSICPELQPALQSNRQQGVPEGCRGDPAGKVKLNILITW